MRNVLAAVPKANAEMVAALIRTIFAQPDAAAVREQLHTVAVMLGRQFPQVQAMLDAATEELLAFTAFPVGHWKKIWSTNPLVIWSRSTGVRDVVDEYLRSRVLPGGRGYLPPSSTRCPGRFDVRCSGVGARFAA